MPTLVHLADERMASKIMENGIKLPGASGGIYCMPVLPNFFVTHQWLRELKSTGVKTLIGVYFKIDSTEWVFAGKYGKIHRRITLGEAIKEILTFEDPLGYELIIDRKIQPNEISRIKHLPQHVGWRYMPYSHGKKPCLCEFCLRGTIKGTRTKKRLEDDDAE